ncbi:MAG: hypothetical protein HQL68_00750 [Magnetococcales bacterium]|nr:hypothetical protein [Magnetococcales bacterium]
MLRLSSLLFVLMLFISGCSSYPWEQADFTIGKSQKELIEITQKFKLDQKQRRELPQDWQISGILDVEHPRESRRNRIIITARKPVQLRLRIYGPFNQVAFDLLVDYDWLQLTKPSKHQVVRVPASLDGMVYLTGFRIDPTDLGQFFKATASPLATQLRDTYDGIQTTTKSGERLFIDPKNGFINIRKPLASAKNQYSVQYFWPDEPLSLPSSALPNKLVITIPNEDTVLTFELRKWKFYKTEPQNRLTAIPAGFSVVEPLKDH